MENSVIGQILTMIKEYIFYLSMLSMIITSLSKLIDMYIQKHLNKMEKELTTKINKLEKEVIGIKKDINALMEIYKNLNRRVERAEDYLIKGERK